MMPLLVVLHGGGSDQNTPFERGDGLLMNEAEKHACIVVSPLGGGPSGGYGAHYSPVLVAGARVPASAPDAPAANRTAEETAKLDLARRTSESDVMMVVEQTAAEYGVDRHNIFLGGEIPWA